jgi:enterobactin synthetase component D
MLNNFSFISPFSVPKISYCRCDYHFEKFNESAFEHYGVSLPLQLAKAPLPQKTALLASQYCARLALINLVDKDDISRGMPLTLNSNLQPKWPRGITGSITYGNQTAIAVIMKQEKYQGLGITCEPLLTRQESNSVKNHVLATTEINRRKIAEPELDFFVTLALSAKKSLCKALDLPKYRTITFQDLYIEKIEPKSLRVKLLKNIGNSWKAGQHFEILYTRQNDHALSMSSI